MDTIGEVLLAHHMTVCLRWLTLTGNQYGPVKHRGIAALYMTDGPFAPYYDKSDPGCARYLRDAITRWWD